MTVNEMREVAERLAKIPPFELIDGGEVRDFAETFLKATDHNRPLEQFGMDMALAERERCAKIAETIVTRPEGQGRYIREPGQYCGITADDIAAAIRNQK